MHIVFLGAQVIAPLGRHSSLPSTKLRTRRLGSLPHAAECSFLHLNNRLRPRKIASERSNDAVTRTDPGSRLDSGVRRNDDCRTKAEIAFHGTRDFTSGNDTDPVIPARNDCPLLFSIRIDAQITCYRWGVHSRSGGS